MLFFEVLSCTSITMILITITTPTTHIITINITENCSEENTDIQLNQIKLYPILSFFGNQYGKRSQKFYALTLTCIILKKTCELHIYDSRLLIRLQQLLCLPVIIQNFPSATESDTMTSSCHFCSTR